MVAATSRRTRPEEQTAWVDPLAFPGVCTALTCNDAGGTGTAWTRVRIVRIWPTQRRGRLQGVAEGALTRS